MQRDVAAIHASVTSQLSQFTSGAWTSSGIIDDLTPQLLEDVHATFKDLDPLIRVRFLVACCLAPPVKKQTLMPGLRKVIQLAQQDEDEWVQALGHTIDPQHASIRLNAQSLQGGPKDIEKTVRDLVKVMDSGPVNTANRMCPTVDTFISNHTAASAAPPAQHSHFTIRENYHEIEAIFLEGRPGDACLPSIISRAAEGSGYAALFTGQHTVTAAPQLRQNKVASTSMFVKSTASLPKAQSIGHRHASVAQQGNNQHPNKRTKLTASLSGSRSTLKALTPSATAGAPPTPSVASPTAAARPGLRPASASDTPAAPQHGAQTPRSGQRNRSASRSASSCDKPKQGSGAGGRSPAAARQNHTDTSAAVAATGPAHAHAALQHAATPLCDRSAPGGAAGEGAVAGEGPSVLPGSGPSLMHASVASSDLPAIHLEQAGSCRHGDG